MRDKRTNVVVGELPGLGDSFFKDMAKTTEASSAAVGEIDGRWAEYSRQYERASHLLIESMETGRRQFTQQFSCIAIFLSFS